jgi:hypothetical protein
MQYLASPGVVVLLLAIWLAGFGHGPDDNLENVSLWIFGNPANVSARCALAHD